MQSLKPVKLFESTNPNNISLVPSSPKRSPVLLNPLLEQRLVSLTIIQDASGWTVSSISFSSDLVSGEHVTSLAFSHARGHLCVSCVSPNRP